MTTPRLMLCTDLDRTLLPNGEQPESASARAIFSRLIAHEHVILVFVTGRHKELVEEAVDTYHVPQPDFVITDVGTRIYHLDDGEWISWEEWDREIAPDWCGKTWQDLSELLGDVDVLQLQEREKQNAFKLSYYVPLNIDQTALTTKIESQLSHSGITARLVWSVDDLKKIGLLDIIPDHAGKLQAIHFLQQQLGYRLEETVFAGDSGNDLPVLTSDLPSVLVHNAADNVREQALSDARTAGNLDRLYLAQGGFLGMNGNYSAGIVEGVIHFRPDLENWLSNTN